MKPFWIGFSNFMLGSVLTGLLVLLLFWLTWPTEPCAKIVALHQDISHEKDVSIQRLKTLVAYTQRENKRLKAEKVDTVQASIQDLAARMAPVEKAAKEEAANTQAWIDVPYLKQKMAELVLRGR